MQSILDAQTETWASSRPNGAGKPMPQFVASAATPDSVAKNRQIPADAPPPSQRMTISGPSSSTDIPTTIEFPRSQRIESLEMTTEQLRGKFEENFAFRPGGGRIDWDRRDFATACVKSTGTTSEASSSAR